MDQDLINEARGYDIDALRAHIDRRLNNIELFRKAITDEEEAITRVKQMIWVLENDIK